MDKMSRMRREEGERIFSHCPLDSRLLLRSIPTHDRCLPTHERCWAPHDRRWAFVQQDTGTRTWRHFKTGPRTRLAKLSTAVARAASVQENKRPDFNQSNKRYIVRRHHCTSCEPDESETGKALERLVG